jgi:hypothetical protein
MMLRIIWILGFVSTREYDRRMRNQPIYAPESRTKSLERCLLEDRLAIILFLAGAIILAYTFLNAPMPN